jgi:hypothetical protein
VTWQPRQCVALTPRHVAPHPGQVVRLVAGLSRGIDCSKAAPRPGTGKRHGPIGSGTTQAGEARDADYPQGNDCRTWSARSYNR